MSPVCAAPLTCPRGSTGIFRKSTTHCFLHTASGKWAGVVATRRPVSHHRSGLNLVLPTSVHLSEHAGVQAQLLGREGTFTDRPHEAERTHTRFSAAADAVAAFPRNIKLSEAAGGLVCRRRAAPTPALAGWVGGWGVVWLGPGTTAAAVSHSRL